MRGGKVESGTAQRKPGGNNPRDAAGKWTEVSAEFRVLDALEKEKNITWTKSGRESAKREAELFDMLEKGSYK